MGVISQSVLTLIDGPVTQAAIMKAQVEAQQEAMCRELRLAQAQQGGIQQGLQQAPVSNLGNLFNASPMRPTHSAVIVTDTLGTTAHELAEEGDALVVRIAFWMELRPVLWFIADRLLSRLAARLERISDGIEAMAARKAQCA